MIPWWVFCPQSEGKNMEDRLSPKAQDQVKKSAKLKSAISDKIVEDRKRASESMLRKKEKMVLLKDFVLILKPNNNVLHLLMSTMRGKWIQ
jgi:hypothetical protein